MSEVNKERLMSDIKTVLADAEDLLKQAASATGERASELRETALTRLKQAKEKAAGTDAGGGGRERQEGRPCNG